MLYISLGRELEFATDKLIHMSMTQGLLIGLQV